MNKSIKLALLFIIIGLINYKCNNSVCSIETGESKNNNLIKSEIDSISSLPGRSYNHFEKNELNKYIKEAPFVVLRNKEFDTINELKLDNEYVLIHFNAFKENAFGIINTKTNKPVYMINVDEFILNSLDTSVVYWELVQVDMFKKDSDSAPNALTNAAYNSGKFKIRGDSFYLVEEKKVFYNKELYKTSGEFIWHVLKQYYNF